MMPAMFKNNCGLQNSHPGWKLKAKLA